MAPRTLVEMCTRVAISNIQLISGFGNMPANDAMRAILKGVKTAQHLRTLEQGSEDIYDETAPHWQRLIKKDFPLLEKQHQWVPADSTHWHKIWEKYKQTQDQAEAEAIAKLKAATEANEKERDSKRATLGVPSNLLPRLPKENRGSRGGHWSTQPAAKSQSFIQKARNEARKETSRFRQSKPTPRVPAARLGQVQKAPESMLNDKRIERQFNPTATSAQLVRPPRISTSSSSVQNEERERKADQDRRDKEARLLRIKGVGAKATPTVNLVAFDNDDDNGHIVVTAEDDLFGDSFESPVITPLAKSRKENNPPLLDISSLEASFAETSGSLSCSPNKARKRSLDETSSPSTSLPAKRRRGGFLSAAPGSNSAPKVSRGNGSPPTTSKPGSSSPSALKPQQPDGFRTSTTSTTTTDTQSTLSTTKPNPLSSMDKAEAEQILERLQPTAPGPSNPLRRLVKSKKPVDIFMPKRAPRK